MNNNKIVSCIRSGAEKVTEVEFRSLEKGDRVFSAGDVVVVHEGAHYCGDSRYRGFLFSDEEGARWYPDDLDSGVKPYVVAVAVNSEFYMPEAEHIETNDAVGILEDDETAAEYAEQDGVRLIRDMPHVTPGVYVDTPENRRVISETIKRYPEYTLENLVAKNLF